jgi:hypothetical protein
MEVSMKKDDLRISIVLYGEIESNPLEWWEWYLSAKGLNEQLGRNLHYLGITGESFPPGCMLTFAGAEKRIKKAVDLGERLKYLSLYSMQNQSMQPGFDHITYMLRTCFSEPHRIFITLLPQDYLKLNSGEIVNKMKKFIRFSSGQIFEMSISESPFGYVMKSNPVSHYKTLKIIREF